MKESPRAPGPGSQPDQEHIQGTVTGEGLVRMACGGKGDAAGPDDENVP